MNGKPTRVTGEEDEMAEKTLFQKILDKELEADLVYEDDLCGAFRDIKPIAPTHILIVPRKPIRSVAQVAEEDREIVGHLLYVARVVAEQERLKDGFRIVVNCGPHGQQIVPHLHLHLIGGKQMGWPPL
jgi:histidine triad (HIT) family protein